MAGATGLAPFLFIGTDNSTPLNCLPRCLPQRIFADPIGVRNVQQITALQAQT
jgi:hypothetical protein